MKFIITPWAGAVALLAVAPLWAQNVETGRVISTTPVTQQVGVPRQVCSNEAVAVAQPKSGAGAMMGAIAGGAIGNAIGRGDGNVAATAIGLIGGALLGDRIEGAPAAQMQTQQTCTTQTFSESRTTYDVVYEYAGKQYQVNLPSDPGATVQIQLTPVGATPPPPPAEARGAVPPNMAAPAVGTVVSQGQPVVVASPPTVVYTTPYYAPYYYAPGYYYPPITFGFRYGGGRRWR